MELRKKYCVVVNGPTYCYEGTWNSLQLVREFETLDQVTSYYRDASEEPNENHPFFPEGGRIIEVYVNNNEPIQPVC